MFTRKHWTAVLAGGVAAASLAGPVQAGPYNEPAFQDELQTCVAAVRDRIDYDGATRIRHKVTSVKPRGASYVFEIDTAVFTVSDVEPTQTLTTSCRSLGKERLIALEIADTTKAYVAKN